MLSLIPTEPVVVVRPTVERDDLGEITEGEPTRPEGVTVAYTLHFPKTYAGSLRGCSVEVRGETYDVVGDPQRTTEAATPGPFNMAVEVTRSDG